MERLFLGIGLAWLAWASRTTPLPPLGIALLVTLVAEFLQQWVPSRLPDTSDLAALLIGAWSIGSWAISSAANSSTRYWVC
jgi:VanZ family protein